MSNPFNSEDAIEMGGDTISFSSGCVWTYEAKKLKYGKLSTKIFQYNFRRFTVLKQCDICAIIGIKRKVHDRGTCYGWNAESKNDYTHDHKYTLCMKCWNKVERYKLQAELMEQQLKLTKQLTTYLYYERKKLKHVD